MTRTEREIRERELAYEKERQGKIDEEKRRREKEQEEMQKRAEQMKLMDESGKSLQDNDWLKDRHNEEIQKKKEKEQYYKQLNQKSDANLRKAKKTGGSMSASKETVRPQSPEEAVQTLAADQQENGCWKLHPKFASVFGVGTTLLISSIPKPEVVNEWGTALVVAFLQTKCSAIKGQWESMEQKANTWLKTKNKLDLLPQALEWIKSH